MRHRISNPNYFHSGDNLTKIDFVFVFLEAEISLVEGVGMLISKVV